MARNGDLRDKLAREKKKPQSDLRDLLGKKRKELEANIGRDDGPSNKRQRRDDGPVFHGPVTNCTINFGNKRQRRDYGPVIHQHFTNCTNYFNYLTGTLPD